MGGYNGLWGIGRTIGTAGYQLDRKKRTDFPDKPTVKRFHLGETKIVHLESCHDAKVVVVFIVGRVHGP